MRKRKAKKRPLLPDPKFNDQLVTRFVNMLMWDGKKSTAFKIFYDSLDIIEKKNSSEKSSLEIWKDSLSNIMPHVEVRSRRVGGATFQIPMQIRPDRKISLGMKWLIGYSRKRNEKSMALKKRKVQLSRKKWIPTKWLKLIKHSHILDFNNGKRFKIYKEYWYCCPH